MGRVGVGDLYQGLLSQRLVAASAEAGGPISQSDLRQAVPLLANPIVVKTGADQVAFLPPPADGGLGAAAAYLSLEKSGVVDQGLADRSVATVATWRSQGGDPLALLQQPSVSGMLLALPASTSFAVVDRRGAAVACALTMENLFGTGRIAPGTGILLGASPAIKPAALLTAAIAWNSGRDAFRSAVGASGQNGAALAGAVALGPAMSGALPIPAVRTRSAVPAICPAATIAAASAATSVAPAWPPAAVDAVSTSWTYPLPASVEPPLSRRTWLPSVNRDAPSVTTSAPACKPDETTATLSS